MKQKMIMMLTILALILIPTVKAETNISVEGFLTRNGCSANSELTQTTCTTVDANGNERTETYFYNAEKNTIRYDIDYSNVKDAVDNSPVLSYIAGNLSVPMKDAYDTSKANATSEVDLSTDGGCNLEKTGFCYSGQGAVHNMEVSMTDRFFAFMIVARGGTLPQEDTSKNSLDPTEEVETITEAENNDSNNPQTGSFLEYGIIAILAIALIAVIILKKRNEVEFRI